MTATVPAGWYSDPAQRHQFRYWDGSQWTAHVSTGGVTSVDPLGPAPAGGAQGGTQGAAGQPAGDHPATMAVSAGTAAPGMGTAGMDTAGTIAASAPADASPGSASPGSTVPGFAVPGFAVPGFAAPGDAAAGTAAAGTPQAGGPAAGFVSPGSASPGHASPGPAQGGIALPGAAAGMGAVPGSPVMPGGPGTPGGPTVPGGPALPGAPARGRSGRRWLMAGIAAVVVLGLLTGLLIWAPWVPPPVLRPAGLAAGSATTSSVSFHWSGPATGPLPDKYLILHDGTVIGSVRGTVTSYQVSGLAPASDFVYQVTAERGGKRSRPSTRLLLTTVTPPVSAARLDGSWTVKLKIRQGASTLTGHPPKVWTEGWTTSPKCPSGPCTVKVTGTLNGRSFSATLKRSGAQYRGTAKADVIPCGSGSAAIASQSTMIFRIKVTNAGVTSSAWTASSWSGSLVVNSPYVSSGSYYCNASSLVFGMSATP